jgi:hypothetical protein
VRCGDGAISSSEARAVPSCPVLTGKAAKRGEEPFVNGSDDNERVDGGGRCADRQEPHLSRHGGFDQSRASVFLENGAYFGELQSAQVREDPDEAKPSQMVWAVFDLVGYPRMASMPRACT